MNVQSIALLFEEGLGQKIQQENKTMTTRVWSHAQFTVLEKAVARGALLPCKTGYDRDSRFGYVLGLELRQRTLCSMTARELEYEGTDDANWEDFAARWAPGVPTDVTLDKLHQRKRRQENHLFSTTQMTSPNSSRTFHHCGRAESMMSAASADSPSCPKTKQLTAWDVTTKCMWSTVARPMVKVGASHA